MEALGTVASTHDRRGAAPRQDPAGGLKDSLGYAAAAAMVAAAAAVATQIPQAQVSLTFVLPVVFAATLWGWGPSLVAAGLGVAAFDFFFTEPRFSFRVDRSADVATLVLLLIVAAFTSVTTAKVRRSALRARSDAKRAQALHRLAQGALAGADEARLLQLAQSALEGSFEAPAVVMSRTARDWVTVPAAVGREILSHDDLEAAEWAIDNGKAVRAASYPFFGSQFDFWPVPGRRVALGLMFGLADSRRPPRPEETVELVSGYLVAADAGRARRLAGSRA